jgi:hypothetical protein
VTQYTNEQIRAAFLRAADRIEGGAPYNYIHGYIDPYGNNPAGCRGGCMLHYVGLELKMRHVTSMDIAAAIGLSDPRGKLYSDAPMYAFGDAMNEPFRDEADAAVRVMRAFADHKFPASVPKPEPSYLAFRSKLLRESVSA